MEDERIPVNIERPSFNTRRIASSIVVDRGIDEVWRILTDYDRLSVYVPNLVKSELVPHPQDGIRLYQEGAQKIVGFDFRASLTMDMTEVFESEETPFKERRILFTLVDSRMFAAFDGEWSLRFNSRKKVGDHFEYTTKLSYRVFIRPAGVVPVLPLEWRIREDVPTNLLAVKRAVEQLPPRAQGSQATTPGMGAEAPAASPDDRYSLTGTGLRGVITAATNSSVTMQFRERRTLWDRDETLAMYLPED